MGKYIYTDLFIEEIAKVEDLRTLNTKTIGEIIKKMPAAEVMHKKNANWVDKYDNKYDNHFYICSCCGNKALYDVITDELGTDRTIQRLTPGCPYCFAIMDEDKVKMSAD